jgi:protein SCO1
MTRLKFAAVFIIFFAASLNPLQVFSQSDPHAEHRRLAQQTAMARGAETKVELPDVLLVDSYGNPQDIKKLFSSHKVVVVDFIFTRCTTICPALTAIMSSTQQNLDQQQRNDVLFISISVDPKNDTPEKMQAYRTKAKADKNWVWLTGRPADINRTLRAFGVPANGRPEDHPPTILVGNNPQNRWLRWIGMPEPKALVAATKQLSQPLAKKEKATHAHH